MMFLRFRLAILAGFLVIIGSVLGVTVAIVDRSQSQQIEAEMRRDLEVTRGFFNFSLKGRWAQMGAEVRLLGSDFAFRKTLATQDAPTIASNAFSLMNRVDAKAVWVTDAEGRLYADTTGKMKSGRSLAKLSVIERARREGADATIEFLDERPYQLVAVAVNAPDLMGFLMAGFDFGDETALQFRQLTNSDLSFVHKGKIFASTLKGAQRADLEGGLPRLDSEKTNLLRIQGERHLILATMISPGVTAYLERSLDEALEPNRKLRRLLVVISLAGLILTAAAGYLVAAGVSRSIQELVETTQRLNEQLSRLDQLKDEFIATVSHDLRGPVGGMVMVMDMISSGICGPVTDKMREQIDLVKESGKRLILFVSNILDAAKIKAGRMELRKDQVRVQELVPPLVRLFSVTAAAKGLALEQKIPEDLPPILGDREKLEQVVSNLVVNAMKFTTRGGRIGVGAEVHGGHVRFRVSDTGLGIAPEDIPKLFKKFGQVDLDRQKEIKIVGTGLGLSICKTLVEGQGGTIWVESEKDKGSSFYFTIPLAPNLVEKIS